MTKRSKRGGGGGGKKVGGAPVQRRGRFKSKARSKDGSPQNSAGTDASSSNSSSAGPTSTSKGFRGKPSSSTGRGGFRGGFRKRDEGENLGPIQPKYPEGFMADAKLKTEKRIVEWLAAASTIQEGESKSQELVLDPWQKQALDALMAGESVIVDAPTTAGKTRVVEAFFHAKVQTPGFRAVYTTPVKSLSNDKLREFREMFGRDMVGIATGDVKENLNAPIVVATLESYRNSLLGTEPDLGRNLVVFDEYHFLQDDSRGSAWEESIILTPPNCQMVLLSASVDNCDEFRKWIEWLRKSPCQLMQVTHRPVPLTDLVYQEGCWIDPALIPSQVLAAIPDRLDRRALKMGMRPDDLAVRLKAALPLHLTPCIIYAGRRLACENIAHALVRSLPPLPESDSRKIGDALDKCHTEFKALSFIRHPMRQMLQTYGVGFHHSGLAPGARMAVEILVKQGLLRFCAATMGLSIGINFAVRSAVISDYERPGSTGFTSYSPSEVLQMLGRAGRRGRDVVGFSLWHSLESYKRLRSRTREFCESRLRNDPTTFLGLVGQGLNLPAIQKFYEKGFQAFSKPNEEGMGKSVARLHRHLGRIGAISKDDRLTPYGEVAKYFPQTGGLFLAREIAEGRLSEKNLLGAAELMAALCLARFKSPGYPEGYRLPFNPSKIEEALQDLYPLELFPELYDLEDHHFDKPPLREFNPGAGFIIRAWGLEEMPWMQLLREVTTEHFGMGDMMNVIYRVSTYLQSLSQARLGTVSHAASALRETLLREPLSFTIGR